MMNPAPVIIHFLTPGSEQECLTAAERSRAAAFRFADDAESWTTWRSGLRRILGEVIGLPPLDVPIQLGPFGKPLLASPHEGIHFSLSHCKDLALVAISRCGPVGIDLEPIDRATDLLGCEEGFCHVLETRALPVEKSERATHLLENWCAKEALLKCIGTGFSHPPTGVRLVVCEEGFTVMADTPLPGWNPQDRILRLRHTRLERYCAALACGTTAVEFNDI
jgi:4'-phosphopantetheinyl transferase